MKGDFAVDKFILSHEVGIRLGFFLGVFGVMAIWELIAPKRPLTVSKSLRWLSNLGIVALNTVLLRLLFPAAAVGFALVAAERGWGLLNDLALPGWLAVLAAIIVLDLAIYLQHVMFHAVPALWRLHRMHHADLDFDVTTGGRFHPIEIMLSMLIKCAVIAAVGVPALAALIFEVLLNATSIFNHSNVYVPEHLDRVLRLFVVTPDMHRVHHSVEDDETNSNFGFNLPWWDRLLGTYRDQPRAGHQEMTIGIRTFREPRLCEHLLGMLAIPFIGQVSDYAINRRTWGKANEAR
jgi:sterol desaturase/sphingolipid hydroxylase (fatty acid hydroxylase superfamily)